VSVHTLTVEDQASVRAAIERARAPRKRMTRTQALTPRVRRPVRDKKAGDADRSPAIPEPLLFVGLCVFCGAPAERGTIACEGHADLPEIDAATHPAVTNSTGGARTILGGSSASTPARRVTP